jgi:hypothetical protein
MTNSVKPSLNCGPFDRNLFDEDLDHYYELISRFIKELESGPAQEIFSSLLSKTASVFFILMLW